MCGFTPTQSLKTISSLLQFAAVCSSSSHFHPVSKIAANPWGQIWVTDFEAGQGTFAGHSGSRRLASGFSRCFGSMAREREAAGRPCFCYALSPGRHRPPASARAYRAASILATNSLAHLIASSTSWSTGRPSARAAYISSHPFCLAMAGGQACARL